MVNYLQWSDDYLIGEIQIDTHHKLFFDMVKDISESIDAGHVDIEIVEIVDFFQRYVDMHFRVEEEIMQKIGYPNLDEHCDIHRGFSESISELSEQLETNNTAATLSDVFTLTQDWFLNHILTEDKKLTEFIKKADAL